MNWEDIKKPFMVGGIRIRSMVRINEALQGKWLWRYLTEENRLWRRIVESQWGDPMLDSGVLGSLTHMGMVCGGRF